MGRSRDEDGGQLARRAVQNFASATGYNVVAILLDRRQRYIYVG